MKRFATVTAVVGLLGCGVGMGAAWADGTWTTLDYPGAFDTAAFGIDGDNIVGH